MKKDSTILGLMVGLIAPVVVILIYWQVTFGYLNAYAFWDLMLESTNLPGLLSIGLMGNLAAFFGFYKLKLDVSARGVIGATFLYGLVIVILRFML